MLVGLFELHTGGCWICHPSFVTMIIAIDKRALLQQNAKLAQHEIGDWLACCRFQKGTGFFFPTRPPMLHSALCIVFINACCSIQTQVDDTMPITSKSLVGQQVELIGITVLCIF